MSKATEMMVNIDDKLLDDPARPGERLPAEVSLEIIDRLGEWLPQLSLAPQWGVAVDEGIDAARSSVRRGYELTLSGLAHRVFNISLVRCDEAGEPLSRTMVHPSGFGYPFQLDYEGEDSHSAWVYLIDAPPLELHGKRYLALTARGQHRIPLGDEGDYEYEDNPSLRWSEIEERGYELTTRRDGFGMRHISLVRAALTDSTALEWLCEGVSPTLHMPLAAYQEAAGALDFLEEARGALAVEDGFLDELKAFLQEAKKIGRREILLDRLLTSFSWTLLSHRGTLERVGELCYIAYAGDDEALHELLRVVEDFCELPVSELTLRPLGTQEESFFPVLKSEIERTRASDVEVLRGVLDELFLEMAVEDGEGFRA